MEIFKEQIETRGEDRVEEEEQRAEVTMGTRDQVYGSVNSLVVRPSDSKGGGGNDYEPGEIRREEPRCANGHGHAYDRAAVGDRLPPSSGYDMKGYKTSDTAGQADPTVVSDKDAHRLMRGMRAIGLGCGGSNGDRERKLCGG